MYNAEIFWFAHRNTNSVYPKKLRQIFNGLMQTTIKLCFVRIMWAHYKPDDQLINKMKKQLVLLFLIQTWVKLSLGYLSINLQQPILSLMF